MQDIIELIYNSTVRIECINTKNEISTGTAFMMCLKETQHSSVPVLVTNKHVIENSAIGKFYLTSANADGSAIKQSHRLVEIENFASQWILHPDPNIDLAVFRLGPLLNKALNENHPFFYMPITPRIIPTTQQRESLSVLEEVIMVGYPDGIWDHVNNFPVIRKGITATHCAVNLNGRAEFLVDMAIFPGSSGSPVFVYNNGYKASFNGNISAGMPSLQLIGINYACAVHSAVGEITFINTPTSHLPRSITQIPNNLGVIINSSKLLDFENLV